MSERKEPRSCVMANACDVALQDAAVEIDKYTSLYDDDKFAELLAGYGYAVVPIAAAKEAGRLREALEHIQWSVITEAIDKYSRGEKSDLVTLGIVAQGVLILDEARRRALAGDGGWP